MRKIKRKQLIIIALALGTIALIYFSFYLSFASGLLGFVAGKLGGGKKAGLPGRVKSIVVPWRNYRLHLHHWLLTTAIIVICIVTGFYVISQQLFFGFMSGLVIQGVYCYDDWHRIVWLNAASASEELS